MNNFVFIESIKRINNPENVINEKEIIIINYWIE